MKASGTLPQGPVPASPGLRQAAALSTAGRAARAAAVTYLPLQVGGLVGRGSREDAGVAEAGAEQGPHHEEEQDATGRGHGRGDSHGQVRAAAGGRGGGRGRKER